MCKETAGIDKAIQEVKNRMIEDSFYLGSIRTETKAHKAVRERLHDARPHIDPEFLTMYDALTAGVLADITAAGEEIRRPL